MFQVLKWVINETILLKGKNTLFNILIREISEFLCYERLLNSAHAAYKKIHFTAKCNSGHIAIQWFNMRYYLDYQYTKIQPYTFRMQIFFVFARYATLVPRLVTVAPQSVLWKYSLMKMESIEECSHWSILQYF